MHCKWLMDVVVRVEIDGKIEIMHQGFEFVVLEENGYIDDAIAMGWVEVLDQDEVAE